MREILFRGKRLDNGGWVTGGTIIQFLDDGIHTVFMPDMNSKCTTLHEGDTGNIISFEECLMYKVDPETVGQYTGLKDRNGKPIFEGDIVDCWSEGVNAEGTVQQRNDGLWIIYPAWQKRIMWGLCPDEYSQTTVDVIGNIHDNPELMEVQA